MPAIYFDVCCLNRPFDDLAQDRIRLESEAVLLILSHIESGEWEWVTSDAVTFEISQTPDPDRRARVAIMTDLAKRSIGIQDKERSRTAELTRLGFRAADAVHIACAENGGVDVLLTTDDQMLRLAARLAGQIGVRVENPVVWLREVTQK